MTNQTEKGVAPARLQAFKLIHAILEEGQYANLSLERNLRHTSLKNTDRRLMAEIVNGTVRMKKHLDWVLNLFMSKGIEKQKPFLRTILRMAVYQLLFMERVPDFAVVNEAVQLTVSRLGRSMGRLSNGILRNMIRNRDKIEYPRQDLLTYYSVFYSHPEWMVQIFLDLYGLEQAAQIMEYNNRPPALDLRVNTLLCGRDELMEELASEGVSTRPGRYHHSALRVEELGKPLHLLDSYQRGCFYVQNQASMLAAGILSPASGELVHDFCCGVGGKTTHIAEIMGNKGNIQAFDLYQHKIDLLKQNCRRLGLDIINARAQDITAMSTPARKAGRVLLDAPCSGLGVLNRRADARWRRSPESVEQLKILQLELLNRAGASVESGGYLLYSTCTIIPQENENVVASFLEQHKDFEPAGFDPVHLDQQERDGASRGMLTIIPGKYDTDGMFFALMRRKTSGRL